MPITIKLYKEAIRAFCGSIKRKSAKPARRRKCHGHANCKKRKRHVRRKRCKVLVYGFDGRRIHPIKTDRRGILQINPVATPVSRTFHEEVFPSTMARSDWTFLPAQETAAQITYSYVVLNRSSVPALVCVEIIPDGEHFAVDSEKTVEPGNLAAIVPATFLRFTRIGVRTVQPEDEPVFLDVCYQTQSAS